MTEITAQKVREMLHYDPNDGLFWWKQPRHGRQISKPVGVMDDLGYKRIMIDGKQYLAHRLAWLHVNGYWPENIIDHIDGNPRNNSIGNLRQCNYSQSNCNTKTRRDNLSGVKGVRWHKKAKKYNVRVCINGVRRSMGLFSDLEFAELVSSEARDKYHKEFARS